ncbi:MAG: hypothetical protein HY979_03495 [Candidatus Magasanikbacteria bacterium]|nr:hypothetical protein [Candidatus Magasanikbacteria bacterium]
MEYKLQLHEFFIEGGNREKSHVLLHITEPSTPSEKQKGYFFAVCELNEGDTKKIVRLQNIVDEIEERYYEAPENINEHSLETVLKKINREHQDEQIDNLHCVLGVIRNENIVFSFCGNPKMLLFYKAKDESHKKMDLINENEDANTDLFSQIVEGKISPNDFLFIATPQLKEYFTDDRLQKIITTRPARQSASHIEKVLSDIHNEISFGGLVVHLKEETTFTQTTLKRKPLLKGGSVKSLNNLFATEKNTANTLAPSMFPKLNKQKDQDSDNEEKLDEYRPIMPTEISATHLRQLQPRTISQPQNTDNFKKYFLLFIAGAWATLKFIGKIVYWIFIIIFKIIVEIGNKLLLLFFVVINYQNRRRNIIENWIKQWQSFTVYLKTMPKTTKIMFGLIGLVVIIFIGSIIIIRSRQAQLAQEQKSQEIIRQISVHKDAADSALIFKDNNAALAEAKIVKQFIAELNCKTYKKQCDDFSAQIEGILSQIRKETVVEPQMLYDFTQNKISLNQLVRINNQILAFSNSSSNIMVYDLLTKQARAIDSKINGFNDATVPKENDYVAFLYNNKDLVSYNPKDASFTGAEISYPNPNVKINSLIVYNRRLYTLDAQNGQIYKHENIKNGFGPGKDWLKDLSINIKNGVSLTTDGDMFVGLNNGQIEKITAGTKQPFTISGLDPELKSADKIWTYTDKQYLYILDSDNKRLIILQKDGTLFGQITTNNIWKHPTGLIVDEQNKRAFILDSNKLWEINL